LTQIEGEKKQDKIRKKGYFGRIRKYAYIGVGFMQVYENRSAGNSSNAGTRFQQNHGNLYACCHKMLQKH